MIQRISSLLKDFNLPAFTAEHNGIHTDRRQKRNPIGGKFMRRGGGEGGRYLKYQVGTGEKGGCRSSGRHSSPRRSVPLPAAYDTDVRHGTGYIR